MRQQYRDPGRTKYTRYPGP